MDVLLPETSLQQLPLSAEPLSQWQGHDDLFQFIQVLYSYFPAFGYYLYRQGKKKMRAWATNFATPIKKAHSIPEGPRRAIEVPNFRENALFGKAAKYVVAWNTSVQSLLEEDGFYSLAHIRESEDEIECSLLLASNFYYKQAVQVLRSFLEEVVLPINFCENVVEFSQWKENNYRTPPLRGRDGLIKRLVERGILTDEIANAVSVLYNDLNGYIHGSENRLIHKGTHTGSSIGLAFKADDFRNWCEYLSRSIDLGIRLLRINYVQWERIRSAKWAELRSRGKVLCSQCHNEEDFDVEFVSPETFKTLGFSADGEVIAVDNPSTGIFRYRCRRCGSDINIVADAST
jgi:hypothetical protein